MYESLFTCYITYCSVFCRFTYQTPYEQVSDYTKRFEVADELQTQHKNTNTGWVFRPTTS